MRIPGKNIFGKLFGSRDAASSRAPTFNSFPRSAGGGFSAARVDRLTEDFNPGSLAPNALHRADSKLMRERARDLVLNNPFAKSAVDAFVSNVIECGITPKPLFSEPDRRRTWMDAFSVWAEDEADITRQQHLYELQALWLEEVIVGGGALTYFREVPLKSQTIPIGVQIIPEEYFADDKDDFVVWRNKSKAANPIIRGIEIESSTGRPLGFWVRQTNPNDIGSFYDEPVKIPADRSHYAFFRHRVGQMRGHTLMHAAIMWLWRLGYYTENEMMASAIKSCFAAVIQEDENYPSDGLSSGEESAVVDAYGNVLENLQPGIIARLRGNGKIQGVGPNTPVGDSQAWLIFIERSIAIGMGLSYEEMARDYSQGSFSSTRAAANADRKRFRPMQRFAINHFCRPCWKWFATTSSRIGLDGFPRPSEMAANQAEWLRCAHRPPGWQTVTPLEDAKADNIRILNGTKSRDDVISAEGGDWEEKFEQIDREEQRANDLGLSFSPDQKAALNDTADPNLETDTNQQQQPNA